MAAPRSVAWNYMTMVHLNGAAVLCCPRLSYHLCSALQLQQCIGQGGSVTSTAPARRYLHAIMHCLQILSDT